VEAESRVFLLGQDFLGKYAMRFHAIALGEFDDNQSWRILEHFRKKGDTAGVLFQGYFIPELDNVSRRSL